MNNKINKKTAAAKRRKIDKASEIVFGVHFFTVFSLIYIVALLLVASFIGAGRSGLASVSAPLQKNACLPAASESPFIEESGSVKASIMISVDDGGYNQKLAIVSLAGSRTLEIANKGVNPHSFVIRELNIDSGPIAPGQTRKIVLEGIGHDLRSYDFYSDIGRDDSFIFGGVIEVTE